jgi:hypothetical protein
MMPNLSVLCALHRAHYRQWRGHRFDPVSGDRWPGVAQVFFNSGCGSTNMGAMRDTVAREWAQKNAEQMNAIVADCQHGHGCADTPDILEWCTSGARTWEAEADGMRFIVDASCAASYPSAGNPAGAVYLVIEAGGEVIHESRHGHPRPARLSAHDYWTSARNDET